MMVSCSVPQVPERCGVALREHLEASAMPPHAARCRCVYALENSTRNARMCAGDVTTYVYTSIEGTSECSQSMWNTMKCNRESFSGALGGVRETHWECVSHALNAYTRLLPITTYLCRGTHIRMKKGMNLWNSRFDPLPITSFSHARCRSDKREIGTRQFRSTYSEFTIAQPPPSFLLS